MLQPFEQLELEFGKWTGAENVVACSSGTAALHLAFEALRLPRGEVVLSDYNMVSCARAVALAGLRPVFVDCDDRLLIDPDQVADAVTKDTVAILATHVYGRRCDMAALNAIANKHDLALVEDLAEAHGVTPHRGSDAACWSFYRNKIVAGEEGGAVAFASVAATRIARMLRSVGFTEHHDYTHIPRGHNYRLANCLAEKVLASLSNVKANAYYRRLVEGWCDERCKEEWRMPKRDAVWVYDLRVPGLSTEKQNEAVAALRKAGVEARHGFKPMTRLDEFSDPLSLNYRARSASQEVIYLPVSATVLKKSVDRMFDVLEEVLCR